MKKRGRQINIKINFTNRWLYTLIAVGVLLIIGVGVYAYGTSNPAAFGHSISELQTCGANQILQTVNGAWACVAMPSSQTETDPTVPAWAKQSSPPVYVNHHVLYGWGSWVAGTGTPPGPGSCTGVLFPMQNACQCPGGYTRIVLGSTGSTTYYSCYLN